MKHRYLLGILLLLVVFLLMGNPTTQLESSGGNLSSVFNDNKHAQPATADLVDSGAVLTETVQIEQAVGPYMLHLPLIAAGNANVPVLISPEEGGTLVSSDGMVRVEVPAGAVLEPTYVRYTDYSREPSTDSQLDGEMVLGFSLEAWQRDDGSSVEGFSTPSDIFVKFEGLNFTTSGMPSIVALRSDQWQPLPTGFDLQKRSITAKTGDFSTSFALLVVPNAPEGALQLAPYVPNTPSSTVPYVFFESAILFAYNDGPVILSSTPDGSGETYTDDSVQISVIRPDGTSAEYSQQSLAVIPPQDLTTMFQIGQNLVVTQLIDVIGPNQGSSGYYLVHEGEDGGDTIPPVISDVSRWMNGSGMTVFRAKVTDNVAVGSVTLLINGQEYEMQPVGDDYYEAIVPVQPNVNEFQIAALDTSGNPAAYPPGSLIRLLGFFSRRLGWKVCQGKSCPAGVCGCLGDPVNTSNGNLAYNVTDLTVPGIGESDIMIERGYNSLNVHEPLGVIRYDDETFEEIPENVHAEQPFGRGWSFPYGMTLIELDNSLLHGVQVRYPDGHSAEFADNGDSSFSSVEPRSDDKMSRDGSGYLLERKDRSKYRFNGDGRLTSITERNGNVITLTYSGERLIRAENAPDHGVTFEYNGDGLISDIYAPGEQHLQYGYQNGLLTSFTDSEGNTTSYQYNGDGRMTAMIDPNGDPQLRMSYDGDGRVSEQTIGATERHTFNYQDNNRRVTLTDALGNQTTHFYDDEYRLVESRDPRGHSEYYAYDDDDNRTYLKDRNGNEWHYSFDDRGNMIQRGDPVASCSAADYTSDVTSFVYDGHDQLTSMTNALAYSWQYEYDAQGNLTHIVAPNGSENWIEYMPQGEPIVVTDALGRETRYAYDEYGNLLRTIDASGHLSISNYDLEGREISYSDANNHTVYFQYDNNGNITAIADPKQQVSSFEYDSNNLLVSKSDRRGVVSNYQYNESQQVSAERDHEHGYWRYYSYDLLNRLSTMTDERNAVTSYAYDGVGNLSAIKNHLDHLTGYEYDPNNNLSAIINALNYRTEMVYDAANRLKYLIDAEGNQTEYCYDAEDQLIRIIDPREAMTSYEYDEMGNLVQESDPMSGVTLYEYDAVNNLIALIDPANYRTDYSYDALNRLTQTALPAVHVPDSPSPQPPTTQFEYDPVGNTLVITSPRGFATSFIYDENDNLLTITDPLEGQTSYSYDEEDNRITLTDANGSTMTTTYNALGLPTVIEDALGYKTRMEYDAAYDLLRLINAEDKPTIYEYDMLGRLIGESDPLGNMTLYQHDALGRVTTVVDGNQNATQYEYDGLDRLIAVTDALDAITRYSYDENSNLATISNANRYVTSFEYDLRNQLKRETNPLGNIWRYSYDIAGNLIQRVDGKYNVTRYHYDSNHRLIQTEYPDTNITFGYDLDGNELQMCDWLGCTSHTYDALGRRISTTDWLGRTISRAYDAVGNQTSLTYPNNHTVSYAYNANNWLEAITNPQGESSGYSYNPLGQVTQLTHPNSVVAQFTYDDAGRLTNIDNRKMLAPSTQSAYAYAMDRVGNRTEVAESRAAFDGSTQTVTLKHSYQYDARNHLKRAATDNPDSDTFYTFDGAGNRLSKMGSVLTPDAGVPELPVGSREESLTYDYNAANQLLSINDPQPGITLLQYDDNGNRSREIERASENLAYVTTYDYDDENRLINVTKHTSDTTSSTLTMHATYTYDGYGRRVSKQVSYPNGSHPDITISYLYDGLDIIGAQLQKNGTTNESYYYLAPSPITGMRRPISMERLNNGERYWYQSDGLDSVIALTNQNGDIVTPFLYEEYGQLLAGTTVLQLFTYTAQDYDPETGHLHFHARYYDPVRGVWLTQDTYRGRLREPMTGHRYGYVGGNPTLYYDLYGFLTVHIWKYRGSQQAWGHASMTLEDGTHISWWPSSRNREYTINNSTPIYCDPANDPQTFNHDVSFEEQKPDVQIKLYSLNEDEIKKWWENYKSNNDNQWCSLSKNCSTTVADALWAGGGAEGVGWGVSYNIVWTPTDVEIFANAIAGRTPPPPPPPNSPVPGW